MQFLRPPGNRERFAGTAIAKPGNVTGSGAENPVFSMAFVAFSNSGRNLGVSAAKESA